MMTPSGSSQHSSLQLCVTLSTVTTLQSHNLESVNRKGIFSVPCSKANECAKTAISTWSSKPRCVKEFNTLFWWGVSSVSVTPKAIPVGNLYS